MAHHSYKATWRQQILNGGTRDEIFYEIDKCVFEKFTEARQECKPVHDMDLRRWALERAAEYPGTRNTFMASSSWTNTFKRNHQISSRKVTKIVSKRNLTSIEDILNNVEEFRMEIQRLQPEFELKNIWNTAQIGFNYEYVDNRTLSWTGEKITFAAGFSPKNKLTHSYTVQWIINAAGEIVGPSFVCLQEATGFGNQVQVGMFQAPNLVVTCSKSGKLNRSQVNEFVEYVVKPSLQGNVLYLLDSWTTHLKMDVYANVGDGNSLTIKVIPKNGTPFPQPLDVYLNREIKYIKIK